MTPETTAQDTFLRELAEALGWKKIKRPPGKEYGMYLAGVEMRHPSWFLTPDGQAYLAERVRAEGWRSWKFEEPHWDLTVRKFHPGDDSELGYVERIYICGVESWAERVAYAVGKMFNVKLPEEVE